MHFSAQMLVLVSGLPVAAYLPWRSGRILANENVTIPRYPHCLPEQALSESERIERIRLLCRFSRSISRSKVTQPRFRNDIILILQYFKIRIKILETLNSQERAMKKIESALHGTIKPYPGFFPGDVVRASVSLSLDGLTRRLEEYRKTNEKLVEIIAEMSSEIDSLLDQQFAGQAESAMLRASACLPSKVGTSNHELTAQNASKVDPISNNELVERFITPQNPQIVINGRTYMGDAHVARKIKALSYLTTRQKVAILLSCAYSIQDAHIAGIYRITDSVAAEHLQKALNKIAKKNPSLAAHLLTLSPKYRRRSYA